MPEYSGVGLMKPRGWKTWPVIIVASRFRFSFEELASDADRPG